MTVTEFIEARLAEQEAPAKLRRCGCLDANHWPPCTPQPWRDEILREVAALRAIMAEHQETDWAAYGEPMCSRCRLRDDEPIPDGHHWVPWPCPTVRAVAAIWSGHPDYPQP